MHLFNRFLVITMPLVPRFIVRKISSKYIAGTNLAAAVETIRELNQKNMKATIDVLGEDILKKEEARKTVKQYLQTLEGVHKENLDATISLKLTAFGLKLDYQFCRNNVAEVLQKASETGTFVRIDMEDASCTQDTIDIYFDLIKDYKNLGLVFQSYLRRTMADVDNIFSKVKNPNFRLVKGIYNEPHEIAFKHPEIIRKNFAYLLEKMLENGAFVGIATHDEQLIWESLRLIDKMNLTAENYEFQMLLGVQENLRDILIREGHPMRLYVPFGEQWYAYSLRRLKENPSIAGYIFRDLFSL